MISSYTRKERQILGRQLAKARESASGTDITHFDRIDETIARLRLNCVSVIFLDFEYAIAENVEELLWQSHVDVNTQFRRALDKLRSESRPVEKRKVEAKQGHFLRISQKFYKGFIKQLSQVYGIPELRRVAKEIDAEGTDEHAVAPSPELAEKVLSSCHLTLIRLGDLGRYRVDAKSNKSYGSALVCYSLAHDLMPDSGYAFHQIAIINVQGGNHLEIVYNFYRSLAVKEPHPSAQTNLEKKFDGLENSRTTRRGRTPPTTSEALILWFVKLHAVFYKGGAVDDNHTALEREVMHRLSMAVKDPSFGVLLLRMALINMSASYVAHTKYTGMLQNFPSRCWSNNLLASPTEAAANFHKYTLHFNARFIHQICEAIENDARETSKQPSPNEEEADATKASIIEALLPVLRIYNMWMASQWSELFISASSPTNVIPHMTRSLARVLTIFCVTINDAGSEGLASCPYLLPEDREIRGLVSLSDDRVPLAAQGYATDNGVLKPYMSDSERWTTTRESNGRKLDILRCAYFLSGEQAVPLNISQKGSELEFQYQDLKQPTELPKPRVAESNATAPPQPNGTSSATTAPQTKAQVSGDPAQAMRSPPKQSTSTNTHQAQEMEQTHATVVDMLSPFLDSPLTDAERMKQTHGSPSYGMHSNTAHELAQELLQSFEGREESTPYYASVSPGSFASSPYGQYFNPTSPNGGQAAKQESHRRTGSSRSIPAENNSNDPFATPHREGFGLHQQITNASRSPQGSSPGVIGSGSQAQASTGGYSNTYPRSTLGNWHQNYQSSAGQRDGQDMPPPGNNPFSSGASAFSNMSSVYQGTPANGLTYDLPARGNSQQQKQATRSTSSAYPMYGQSAYSQAPNGASQQFDSGYSMYGKLGNTQSQNSTSQAAASHSYAMYGNIGNSQSGSGNGQGSTSRPYQTSNSASNYDAQIFEAAMRGNK